MKWFCNSLQLIFANFAMDSIQDGGAPAFLAPGEVGSKSGGKLGGPVQKSKLKRTPQDEKMKWFLMIFFSAYHHFCIEIQWKTPTC